MIDERVNIDDLPWQDYDKIQSEAEQIRTSIKTADELIKDAEARYKKRILAARSKKQAADLESQFAELQSYNSLDEIADAYGYDYITERERDRLISLWEAREQARHNNGVFSDPVIDLLQIARRVLGDKYRDKLDLADTMRRIQQQQRDLLLRERWEGK